MQPAKEQLRLLSLAAALLIVLSAASAPLLACPNCSDALGQQSAAADANTNAPKGNPALGYFWSILAMLAMLSVVAGSLIRLMVQASQQVPDAPAEDDTPQHPAPPER